MRGPATPFDRTRRARLLVVDDEPGMLRAVARVLGTRHDVVAVSSPSEALAAVERLPPDIAIVDLRMPEMNGFELTAKLKQAVPGVDVILMTGSVSEPDAKLVRAIREHAFYFIQKPFDREVLETLVERCLELRRLEEAERRHTRRLEAELEAARVFQRSLLPRGPVCIGGITLEGRSEPCDELGGDLFDYADAGDGRASFLVADVSGHGAAAAMLTGIVKGGFHAARDEGFAPVAVLERIAAGLSTLSARTFVTVFAGRVLAAGEDAEGPRDSDRRGAGGSHLGGAPRSRDASAPSHPDAARHGRRARLLEYASAGHPPALLVRPPLGIETLPSTGLLLSPALPSRPGARTVPLAPGDRVLVYTDGIVEAGSDDDAFGDERLASALVAGRASKSSALLDHILERVRAHGRGRPAADDCTLLVATAE